MVHTWLNLLPNLATCGGHFVSHTLPKLSGGEVSHELNSPMAPPFVSQSMLELMLQPATSLQPASLLSPLLSPSTKHNYYIEILIAFLCHLIVVLALKLLCTV
mgnify:CR=1 FL=1